MDNQSLGGYTRIVVLTSSGVPIEVLIHYDEAVAEAVAEDEAEEAIGGDEGGINLRES